MMTSEKMDIDIVVLWVDGNDPEWQAEKAKYQDVKLDDGNSVNRFRDWGLMQYWFRAVEKFMPWARTVHFVTCGHIPEWLDLDCPKLNHVRHEDYMPDGSLPTFSSHALEMNLHRIPDLAEHFVYFNDDMFVLRSLPETAFFRDGLPCTFGGEVPLQIVGEQGIWQHAVINNLGIINKHFNKNEQISKFGKKYASKEYRWQDNVRTKTIEKLFPECFVGFKNIHAPGAYCKSTFYEIWNAEPELLKRTTMHRFRNADDVNQWLALWWQVANGKFAPFSTDNIVSGVDNSTIEGLCRIISNQTHDMICINDPEYEINFDELSEKLHSAFDKILPEKSAFER